METINVIDLIALVFAASVVVDVLHNGEILSEFLAFLQAKADMDIEVDPSLTAGDEADAVESLPAEEPQPLWLPLANFCIPTLLARAWTCPYCFSFHTPVYLAVLFLVPSLFFAAPWDIIIKMPIYVLAATRIGWIINSLVPRQAQYERRTDDSDESVDDDSD